MRSFSKSKQEFSRAKRVLAGGVNSPVRSFQAMGGTPLVFKKAKGAYLFDVDGHKYIDYCQSWGALALGHADPSVCRAIAVQAGLGTSFGAVTPYETQLATFLRRLFPSCQRLRFVSSGTEAVMSAVRLARGVTGKERILKFEGCYHGHLDSLLVRAGSGLATLGRPSSLGVPSSFVSKTTTLPYNDSNAVKQAFRKFKDIACVIVEPVAGNMGVIPAKQAFLKLLRQETRRHKALLIFDEVMTGLRAHSRGVQGLYGIQPDLTTLGNRNSRPAAHAAQVLHDQRPPRLEVDPSRRRLHANIVRPHMVGPRPRRPRPRSPRTTRPSHPARRRRTHLLVGIRPDASGGLGLRRDPGCDHVDRGLFRKHRLRRPRSRSAQSIGSRSETRAFLGTLGRRRYCRGCGGPRGLFR